MYWAFLNDIELEGILEAGDLAGVQRSRWRRGPKGALRRIGGYYGEVADRLVEWIEKGTAP